MSSRATLAAAKGRNFNVGAEFTVTVTVTVTASRKAVDDVPFATQGEKLYQMNHAFWKVSPPQALRRTVRRGSACK
jgi:hypothetical protein